MLGSGLVDLGLDPGDLLAGRVELVEQGEHPALHRLPLPAEALDLEPHVLGLLAAHAPGEQPRLGLTELRLEDGELSLPLVDLQLQVAEGLGSSGELLLQPLQVLVGLPVLLELGQRLPPVEEAVDVQIDLLDVEQVVETEMVMDGGA